MARVDGLPRAALHDGGDDIVYDSQEELDQWPDSQIVPESEPGAIETVEEPRSSGKLQSSQTCTTEEDPIAGLEFTPPKLFSPQRQRTGTSRPNTATSSSLSQRSNPAGQDDRTLRDKRASVDTYGFESGDDDLPVLIDPGPPFPQIPSPHTPASLAADHGPGPENPPRRALRARKPEQQMPYTLDLLRHRDQFRRRGLKPVQNPGDKPKARKEYDGDQYQADEEDVEIDRDEIYRPPKTTEEPAPKRRRIEQNKENRQPELPKIRINRGSTKFQDPREFDIRRGEDRGSESPGHEVSDYDFNSGEEPSRSGIHAVDQLSPEKHNLRDATARLHHIIDSPPSTNSSQPVPRRIIPISSDLSDSDSSSRPEIRQPTRSPSTSSSDSDTDLIKQFKKKARGVLPGSFFTVRAKDQSAHIPIRHNQTNHGQDRKGLAKTKVRHCSRPLQFACTLSSGSEAEEELVPKSLAKEKRNFVDLTREEMIDDWDIEEDLIDRMLNWGGNGSTGFVRPRSKSNQVRKNKPKPSHAVEAPGKRKRQRRINEFAVPTSRKPNTKRSGPKLSIVDACDIHQSGGFNSPPQFLKIARRQSLASRNFGRRRAPNRKSFSFADQEDQEDVATVIAEWENGSIAEGFERRKWSRPPPSRLGPEQSVTGIGKTVRPQTTSVGKENVAPPEKMKHTINKFIRRGAPISSVVEKGRSRGRVPQNTKFFSTGEVIGTTKARHMLTMLPPPTRLRRPNDVATWLQNSISKEPPEDLDSVHPPAQMDLSPPPPRRRVRKLQRPSRRDVNKFDKRFRRPQQREMDVPVVRQLSLDDVWFTNEPTSLTFGITPLPDGAHLNSSTLMGKQLVAKALNTKAPIESEPRLWEKPTIRMDIDVEAACEQLAVDLDEILDSIEESRLSGSHSPQSIRTKVLQFADFIVNYLSNLSSSIIDIQMFGSKQMRLTEIAIDRLDGTILSGSLDLNDDLCLSALALLQTLLVGCHQLCTLTSHDINILGANEILSKLSRRILLYLLNGGFEPVQQAIRRMRGRTTEDDEDGCDSILLDIWSTLYHLLNNRSDREPFPQFWNFLETELEITEATDAKLLDRGWYTIMNISAATVFNLDGIAQPRSNRPLRATDSIWSIVNTIMTPFLRSYSTAQHHRYDAYIRNLLGRCHTLLAFWGWSSGAKSLLTTIYTFFTERRFDNLKTEALSGFPKFFQTDPSCLEIHATDNTFVIFLKLIVSYINLESTLILSLPRRERLAAWKDLDRFVNRIIPLRTYRSSFAPLDYIALQNHYCLMLTLYWVAPERSRPSVERIRDVIDLEMAPAPAQVICMETWKLLAQLVVEKEDDLESIKEWFAVMFHHAMKEFRGVGRREPSDGQMKSKIRAFESIVTKGIQALTEIIRLSVEVFASLLADVTDQLVKSSHEVPIVLTRGLLNLLNAFFTAVDAKYVVTTFRLPPPATDEDSQDYGDSTFMEEFIAVQENLNFPVGPTISNICSHLYRVVANLFGSVQTKSEKIGPIIDTWVRGISILVRHRQQNWTAFLQYGGEWERLHSTNSRISRRWCPYILTRVLKADLDAYCQGQDHFISAWFESIIEPDLDGQHALTELLLNVDDENTVLENSVFARNSEGTYQVSSDALFEARPALIVHALANMGKHFEQLLNEKDNAAIAACKQRYLDYLHRMLSSMKSIYLEMKDTESEDLVQYISLSQHVVGNIIQYCSSFLKEIDRTFKDLPILDYFLSGETFPQPGSNEIGYAAQRLRGIARKDKNSIFSHATQIDIFWSVKSFLERAIQTCWEEEFVEFMVLALGQTDGGVGDHVRYLRRYVVGDIFCEYFKLARESPGCDSPVWGYVVPISRCVREVFVNLWETMTTENIDAIIDFVDLLSKVSLVMFGVVEIILDQAQMGQAPFTIVCARIFDFMIFLDHVLFYAKDIPGLAEKLTLLEWILGLFRAVAKGEEMLGDHEMSVEMPLDGAYIHSTVRREMRTLQLNTPPIQPSRLQEISNVLLHGDSKGLLEDGIVMYI